MIAEDQVMPVELNAIRSTPHVDIPLNPWFSEYHVADQFSGQQSTQPFDLAQHNERWLKPFRYVDGYHHREALKV